MVSSRSSAIIRNPAAPLILNVGRPARRATVSDKTSAASNPDFHIRPATDADRPRLIALINEAFSIETFLEGSRTDEDRLAATMLKGPILLTEDNSGQLLACVSLEVHGVRGYLGQLAVDPAHQGKGLGYSMVKAAEQHLRKEGCEAVDITVLNMRPELHPIYRRFGYVETGVVENFRPVRQIAPGVQVHGIKMSKTL
jgi:predicted N-acetyltransferase YhbS